MKNREWLDGRSGLTSRVRHAPISDIEECDIVRRALILVKEKRIGVLWSGRAGYAISTSIFDPHGSRKYISLADLKVLVGELELKRKPVGSDGVLKAKSAGAGK